MDIKCKERLRLISRAGNNHYPLPCWAVIAATVRAMLWASVTENEDACPITRVMVEEMLESEDSIYNKLESLNPLIATFLENALETSNGIKIDYAIDARDLSAMSLLLLIWYIMVREISFINGLKVFSITNMGQERMRILCFSI